jgi:hypothetical protein
MLNKIICFILGHKVIHKAYTGGTIKTIGPLGNESTITLFKWQKSEFCTRCGKDCK